MRERWLPLEAICLHLGFQLLLLVLATRGAKAWRRTDAPGVERAR